VKLPEMNAGQFAKLLVSLRACNEAQVWAKGKSLTSVIAKCDRGDWLLWLLGNMADKDGWATRKQVVLMACACVEPSLKYVAKDEKRPAEAIRIARLWCEGKATLQEVRNAADAAADAAYAAADAAAYAAADAAAADAAYAAAAAADAAYAAYAAADAAYAAADAAAYAAADAAAYAAADAAAADAARGKSLKESADIVRKMLKELP